MTDNTFICDVCGGEFEDRVTPAQAEAQYLQNFTPHEREGERAHVCDRCYEDALKHTQKRRTRS